MCKIILTYFYLKINLYRLIEVISELYQFSFFGDFNINFHNHFLYRFQNLHLHEYYLLAILRLISSQIR